MSKTKICFEIDSCRDCPYFEADRQYTPDSFEFEFKWTCKKEKRVIAEWVSWNETAEIPDWCPIKVKK